MFKLSQLVGSTIDSAKYSYNPLNESGLQEYHALLRLTSGVIVDIPTYDDEEIFEMNESNRRYFQEMFDKGKELPEKEKSIIVGSVILDVIFQFDNGKISEDRRAYLKLSNTYYVTEIGIRPVGLSDIGLIIVTEEDFKKILSEDKGNLKSYLSGK